MIDAKLSHSALTEQYWFRDFYKIMYNQKIMKLKLEILDKHINLYLKIHKFSSSFYGINNFVNLVILLEQQFSSATVSDSKIYIKSKMKSNLMN